MKRFCVGLGFALLMFFVLPGCGDVGTQPQQPTQASVPVDDAKSVSSSAPTVPVEKKYGTAIMLVLDNSGSMNDPPRTGGSEKKLDIAKKAALQVAQKVETFAKSHPEMTIKFGIMKFSSEPSVLLEPAQPDVSAVRKCLDPLNVEGGTNIGDAINAGKKRLTELNLSNEYIVLVTDGENTGGADPTTAASAISKDTGIFLIGFDVNAAAYAPMKPFATILTASDAKQLDSTLDFVLDKKILLEKAD